MIGKEVNETTQTAAEGAVWGNSAAEYAYGPFGLGDVESVIHTSDLIHEECPRGELARS
jgi:hypothetical protein